MRPPFWFHRATAPDSLRLPHCSPGPKNDIKLQKQQSNHERGRVGAAVGRVGRCIHRKINKIDFNYINYNMYLVCFENRPSSLTMAYNCQILVVQCMNDEWVEFRSHRGLGLASTVSKQAGAAVDVYFAIFCVNCLLNSKRIKRQKPACI